eukprot:3343351-Prymnesium_polylepis.1
MSVAPVVRSARARRTVSPRPPPRRPACCPRPRPPASSPPLPCVLSPSPATTSGCPASPGA